MKQQGFTLVELAIVLMIIGLLIGGILKGQELIENARIVKTINQINGYKAATITFQDSYGKLPGDLPSPGTRLPNCTIARCTNAGNGDGILNYNDEMIVYWIHMAKANLISGVGAENAVDQSDVYPRTADGMMNVLFYQTVAANSVQQAMNGHYVILYAPGYGHAASAIKTRRLDSKMDDGKPGTGDVRATGDSAPDASCATSGEYLALTTSACNPAFYMGF